MPGKLTIFVIIISFIILAWFLKIQFKEKFSENINNEIKLGKNLIRGTSIYFANPQIDKGYLSKIKL